MVYSLFLLSAFPISALPQESCSPVVLLGNKIRKLLPFNDLTPEGLCNFSEICSFFHVQPGEAGWVAAVLGQ